MTQRCLLLQELGQAILAGLPALVELMCREMGKLEAQAEDEVRRGANWCEFMAAHAPQWLADEFNSTGQIQRQPVGVVLAVTPWNYPVWQILRPLVAALAAGNAVVVKPADNVAQTSALLESICATVLPAGLMQCLWLDDAGTQQALAHPAVNMLVCTGSERTGRHLGALAAQQLKPAVLELGGNNPLIVCDDADLVAAAHAAAESRCLNAGQACTAAKRFIVHAEVAEAFTGLLMARMGQYHCGVNLAPLARADQPGKVAQQIGQSIEQGATLLLGGRPVGDPGNYFPPTILTHARPGMAIFDEELFAPVAVISLVRNDAEALCLANAVRQNLAASIWSSQRSRAADMAKGLRAGMVCFNTRPTSRFELPFAGSGASGYGSTLGRDGLLAFTRAVGWLNL